MIYIGNRLKRLQGEKTIQTRDYIKKELYTTRKRNYINKDYMEEKTK